jgi:hypothetical protein
VESLLSIAMMITNEGWINGLARPAIAKYPWTVAFFLPLFFVLYCLTLTIISSFLESVFAKKNKNVRRNLKQL